MTIKRELRKIRDELSTPNIRKMLRASTNDTIVEVRKKLDIILKERYPRIKRGGVDPDAKGLSNKLRIPGIKYIRYVAKNRRTNPPFTAELHTHHRRIGAIRFVLPSQQKASSETQKGKSITKRKGPILQVTKKHRSAKGFIFTSKKKNTDTMQLFRRKKRGKKETVIRRNVPAIHEVIQRMKYRKILESVSSKTFTSRISKGMDKL